MWLVMHVKLRSFPLNHFNVIKVSAYDPCDIILLNCDLQLGKGHVQMTPVVVVMVILKRILLIVLTIITENIRM